MDFLRNIFEKKGEGSEKPPEETARLLLKVKTCTWSVIPGEFVGLSGFLVTGKDGNVKDGYSVDKIEGSKILIVHPDHKKALVSNSSIRSRVIYETSNDNIVEVLKAMDKLERSRRTDSLAVITSSFPDFSLKKIYLLTDVDAK
jgi:hypothetical protein